VADGDAEALGRAASELIADPERVRSAGLERANMFSWPKTARLTIAAYESLL
jgi:glycosyltransferase involved in cell wall biosynthesis